MFSSKPKVVIFGCGQGGQRAFAYLAKVKRVVAFADNSTAKHGKTLCGKTILSPADAVKRRPDEIWVASMYAGEISSQLVGLKYPLAKINIVEGSILNGQVSQPLQRKSHPPMGTPRVIIWGAEAEACRAYHYYKGVFDIIAFTTLNVAKHGTRLFGRPVLSPEGALALAYDRIWIAQSNPESAIKDLARRQVGEDWVDVVDTKILNTPIEADWPVKLSWGRRPVLIWGTGMGGRRTYQMINTYDKVLAFIDSDPRRQGYTLYGKPVISAKQAMHKDFQKILVASTNYASEIIGELKSLHVPMSLVEVVDSAILTDTHIGGVNVAFKPATRWSTWMFDDMADWWKGWVEFGRTLPEKLSGVHQRLLTIENRVGGLQLPVEAVRENMAFWNKQRRELELRVAALESKLAKLEHSSKV